jgi:hypothetical protein
LRQRYGLIVKGKRISCPPHHDYEHGFPLIRNLRASAQRSRSVLFSFVLSLLIVAGSSAIRQSKTILARSGEAGRGFVRRISRLKALKFYPPFYPPMETFGHYLSAREIMRFSRIT